MKKTVLGLAALLTLCLGSAFAQQHKVNEATYISDEEIKTVLKNAPPKVDQQLKVVDAGPYYMAVGIIHRGPTKDSTDGTTGCLIHHNQTENYVIVSGSGTLVTGGVQENMKESNPEGEGTKILNGPSASGRVKLSTAKAVKVKQGDVIIIPPNVCHNWMGITDHVDYLSVRPDPDHVLPLGYVNPAIKDMKP